MTDLLHYVLDPTDSDSLYDGRMLRGKAHQRLVKLRHEVYDPKRHLSYRGQLVWNVIDEILRDAINRTGRAITV